MTSVPESVLGEIKETFGRVTYTHKTHEKEAERKRALARAMKIANVAVIGLTAAAAILAPLLKASGAAWFAALSAVVALVFATWQLSFDPASAENRHVQAAKSYLALRNDYRRLIADANDLDQGELRERRDRLGQTLENLERTAPPTSPKSYAKAREALRGSEELTFSDEEFGHMLGGPRADGTS